VIVIDNANDFDREEPGWDDGYEKKDGGWRWRDDGRNGYFDDDNMWVVGKKPTSA